mmetsp:Transcript_62901/g.124336  ORF Transcript_62901/g.124336 Transcript_62901/m.124336 type:complete len:239 (-) Transcript_62901:1968-2684(-)
MIITMGLGATTFHRSTQAPHCCNSSAYCWPHHLKTSWGQVSCLTSDGFRPLASRHTLCRCCARFKIYRLLSMLAVDCAVGDSAAAAAAAVAPVSAEAAVWFIASLHRCSGRWTGPYVLGAFVSCCSSRWAGPMDEDGSHPSSPLQRAYTHSSSAWSTSTCSPLDTERHVEGSHVQPGGVPVMSTSTTVPSPSPWVLTSASSGRTSGPQLTDLVLDDCCGCSLERRPGVLALPLQFAQA